MRVRIFCNWESDEHILKRFKDNFIIENDNRIEFTLGEDYDTAVVFNRANVPLKEGVKIITFCQEPSWSPVYHNNPFLLQSDAVYFHDLSLLKINNGIEKPLMMFYHDHVHNSFFNKENIKTKKLSMIVSSARWSDGHKKRMKLLTRILNSDLDIDIYGKGLDNIPDPRIKGFIEYKYQGLQDYEFSIALENSYEKNYVTEKFFDCVLNDTTPIYCGAPNIKDIYSACTVLDINSTSIIEDIKYIINNSDLKLGRFYNKMNGKKYFTEYNPYEELKKYIK